jgi:hypothetical protein
MAFRCFDSFTTGCQLSVALIPLTRSAFVPQCALSRCRRYADTPTRRYAASRRRLALIQRIMLSQFGKFLHLSGFPLGVAT